MIFTGVEDEINIRYSSTLIKLRIQNSLVFSILQQYTTHNVKSYLDLFSCKELVQLTHFLFTKMSSTTLLRYQSHVEKKVFVLYLSSYS